MNTKKKIDFGGGKPAPHDEKKGEGPGGFPAEHCPEVQTSAPASKPKAKEDPA